MELHIYISFLIASAIILVIPGPTIITLISQSVDYGKESARPLILGVLMGDFVAMALSILGLGALLQTSALLYGIFKWIGAFYLVYLGLSSWIKKEKNDTLKTEKESQSNFQFFKTTFFVTVLNPKSLAFFVAFFPQFIDQNKPALLQFLILAISFLILTFVNAVFYANFATKLSGVMQRNNVKKWFKRASGSVLIGAGIMTATIKKSH